MLDSFQYVSIGYLNHAKCQNIMALPVNFWLKIVHKKRASRSLVSVQIRL